MTREEARRFISRRIYDLIEEHVFCVCPDRFPMCYDEPFGEFEGRALSMDDVDLVLGLFVEVQDEFDGPGTSGSKHGRLPTPKPTGEAGARWEGYEEAKRKVGR